jgi:hypothetical protein
VNAVMNFQVPKMFGNYRVATLILWLLNFVINENEGEDLFVSESQRKLKPYWSICSPDCRVSAEGSMIIRKDRLPWKVYIP